MPGPSRPILLALAVSSIGLTVDAGAQALTGTVRDDSTGRVLGGVMVAIEGTTQVSRTGDDGSFVIGVPGGRSIAIFQRIGYRPRRVVNTLSSSDTALMDVRLVPMATPELETVEVTGRRNPRSLREAFVERQRLGFGKFLDSTQLRRMDGRAMPDILRGMGLKLAKWAECTPAGLLCPWEYRAAHPTKTSLTQDTPCYASVMLDGMFIYRAGTAMRPPDFSREFQPYTLESVEYYRSTAQLPQEFMVSAMDCGIVVMWSRRR